MSYRIIIRDNCNVNNYTTKQSVYKPAVAWHNENLMALY